ncbi:hypothetical protein MBLNU457_4051t1 [Dothideomycetes sp. NU457]
MRPVHAIVLCLTALVGLGAIFRHHILVLTDVARTYATFHSLIQQHDDLLLRYSPNAHNTSDHQGQRATKIIHQIDLSSSDTVTGKHHSSNSTCRQVHPAWEYKLWTDSNATAFMRENFSILAPHYEAYRQPIQKANILRYAVLYHYGGVYLDLDVDCLAPLDNLLYLPLLTPGAYPAGVNNAFILARPQHPFLGALLQAAPSLDLRWPLPYVENMLSTGCMFFSNRWMAHVRALQAKKDEMSPNDQVFIISDETGNMDPHMLRGKVTTPLFTHHGASSWHSWDAAVIVLIGKHYILIPMDFRR